MRWGFSIKEAGQTFLRQPGTIYGSIFAICFSILLFSAFLLLTWDFKKEIDKVKENIAIEVYLVDSLSISEKNQLKKKLKQIPGVRTIIYKSKSQAKEEMKDYLDEELIQGLEINPFPASFTLKLEKSSQNLNKVEEIVSQVQKLSGAEDLEYGKGWVSRLEKIFLTFFVVDLMFGILLTITVILVIGNTVRLSIYSRTSSIQVMRLLGATRRYVSLSFVLEGMIQGVIGASLGIAFLFIIHQIFSTKFLRVEFLPIEIVAGIILWGVFLGGAGGLLAIRKHL